MKSLLEQKSEKYATRNTSKFLKKVKKFNVSIKQETEKNCVDIYRKYKTEMLLFDNIIDLYCIFQDDYYKNILHKIKHTTDYEIFLDIYTDSLGKIYKKLVSGIETKRLGLFEKIENCNQYISNLELCVKERLRYHFWSRKHTKKYNVLNHQHEILMSVYFFNRIKDVQTLLNTFIENYKESKEKMRIELKKRIRKKYLDEYYNQSNEAFDDISKSSDILSETFETFLEKKKSV